MIYNYDDFLLEHSKNDPIPELTWDKKDKTIIFLLGAPGAGKSTFTKNFLLSKLDNYKIFDPDAFMRELINIGKEPYKNTPEERQNKFNSIKLAIRKIRRLHKTIINLTDDEIYKIIDENLYVKDSYPLLERMFLKFLTTNENADIIYDTTGNNFRKLNEYSKIAKKYGYKILFIKVSVTPIDAIKSNLGRVERSVQLDYQMDVIKNINKLETEYYKLNPDAYYIYDRKEDVLYKVDDVDGVDGEILVKFVKNNVVNK